MPDAPRPPFPELVIAIEDHLCAPDGRFLVGVVLVIALSPKHGKAHLADNTHFDRDEHESFEGTPFFHVNAICRPDPADLYAFSPLARWSEACGHPDPVALSDLGNALGVPDAIDADDDASILLGMYNAGNPWSVVRRLRCRTRIVAAILHHAALGADVPCPRVRDDRIAVFRSRHYQHHEEPLSVGARGQWKHLLPTAGWWEEMQAMAHARRDALVRSMEKPDPASIHAAAPDPDGLDDLPISRFAIDGITHYAHPVRFGDGWDAVCGVKWNEIALITSRSSPEPPGRVTCAACIQALRDAKAKHRPHPLDPK